jgi:hypothetical protein
MGGSGIRSAVGAVVGLCCRLEVNSLLKRACSAMILGDCSAGKWGFYADPVSPATLIVFFTGNLADWLHPLAHELDRTHRSLCV